MIGSRWSSWSPLLVVVMMLLLADLVLESSMAMGVIQTSNRCQQRSVRVLKIHPAIMCLLQSSPGPSVGFLSSFFGMKKRYSVSMGSLVYFYAIMLDSLRGNHVVENKM